MMNLPVPSTVPERVPIQMGYVLPRVDKKEYVKYNDDRHEYKVDGVKYTSVTTFIHKFERPYPRKFWLVYKSYERIFMNDKPKWDYYKKRLMEKKGDDNFADHVLKTSVYGDLLRHTYNSIDQEWIEKNRVACEKGSKYHDEQEAEALAREYDNRHGIINKVVKHSAMFIPEMVDGWHREKIVYDHAYGISGRADMIHIETIDGIRYVDIDDYKTNKRLLFTNGYGDTMLEPVSHMPSCNGSVYELQLSLYAWCMERHGFRIRSIRLSYVTELGEFAYDLTYRKLEIETMLNYAYSRKMIAA